MSVSDTCYGMYASCTERVFVGIDCVRHECERARLCSIYYLPPLHLLLPLLLSPVPLALVHTFLYLLPGLSIRWAPVSDFPILSHCLSLFLSLTVSLSLSLTG